MPLTDLLDLELAVPDPDALVAFWQRRGLTPDETATGTTAATLGTVERPSLLRVRHAPYRHVSEVRLGCESDADLDDIVRRLAQLGIDADRTDGSLRVADPICDHDIVVDVAPDPPVVPVAPPDATQTNAPGRRDRLDRRAPASLGATAHAPRRVGHVVFGTPDVEASTTFYVEGLGFKISDLVGGGLAAFLRCSPDHHNLLLAPAPVPCLNHYAFEMDDIDAIGLAGMQAIAEDPECGVAGIGRHVVGANLFWYLLDPAGGMFELFADMDQITDDDRWEREERRDDWDPFTVGAWMPAEVKPDFWLPTDIDAIARGRDARVKAGR